MNKIYLSGNYVIVERDGNVYEYPRTLSVYTLEGSNYVIKERIDDGQLVIPIAQIGTYFDEAGAVAYDEASLVTFLRENTGFKTAGGGSPATEFIMLIKTDNSGTTADNQFLIKTILGGYNYDVDWGDGNTDTGLTGDITHTYSSAGTYTVQISGLFPRLYGFGATDTTKILDILNWGNIAWGNSLEWMFYNADGLTTLSATDTPDFSSTTILTSFFRSSNNFAGGGNIENWDVSNIQRFAYFFEGTKFNADISGWDVSSATNFLRMFYSNQLFNKDISGWNVQNVTDMTAMLFANSLFNQNLGNWEIASLTSALQMFYNSGMSTANYTDTIVGWANYVFTNGAPLNVNMGGQNGRTFDTTRSGGDNFADAGAARTYLTTTAGWTISGDTVI